MCLTLTLVAGKLYSNASDTLGVQSLSVDPRPLPYGSSKTDPPRHFIGLGVCCDTDSNPQCDAACRGHADELILLAYSGDKSGAAPYFLALVEGSGGEARSPTPRDHSASLQLGVVLKMPGWSAGLSLSTLSLSLLSLCSLSLSLSLSL